MDKGNNNTPFVLPPHFVAKDADGLPLVPKKTSEDDDGAGKPKNKTNMFLGQNANTIRNWPSVTPAYREIFQNMLDGMVSARGFRFEGLSIEVQEGGNVYFYTNEFLFGAIVMNSERTQISFVNYAPGVHDLAQVIQFGSSSKRNKVNQVGLHGEGLKRAMLWFLTHGYTNETYFSVYSEETRRLRLVKLSFKMKHNVVLNKDDMCVTIRNIEPHTTAIKGYPFRKTKQEFLPDAFCVTLFNERGNIPIFNVNDYIVNDWTLLRGRKIIEQVDPLTYEKVLVPDTSDMGYVVPNERGKIYVSNFYVMTMNNACFGYNIFIKRITRDRDLLDQGEVIRCVARIWTQLMSASDENVKRFCDAVLPNKTEAQLGLKMTIEETATRYFPHTVKGRIYAYLSGPRAAIPATEAEIATSTHVDNLAFILVNTRQLNVIADIRQSIDARLHDIMAAELKTCTQTKLQFDCIKLPVILLTKVRAGFPIKYMLYNDSLFINADLLLGGITELNKHQHVQEVFWTAFIFDIMPTCFGKQNRDACDKKGILAEIAKARSPPPAREIIIEEGEVGDPRKRPRKDSPPATPPTTTTTADAYEPYTGPQLFVLKKK
jgi:hypothetical protein